MAPEETMVMTGYISVRQHNETTAVCFLYIRFFSFFQLMDFFFYLEPYSDISARQCDEMALEGTTVMMGYISARQHKEG